MKLLITAGPTRESIDRVRYLSNRSSGKMGYALAQVARQLGHQVTLISGPVNIHSPPHTRLPNGGQVWIKKVETAREMRRVVLKYLPQAEALIMAAAVGDYRPFHFIRGKLKKPNRIINLKLVPNPDILKEIGRKRRNKLLVGFALETSDYQTRLRRARIKLREKHLNYIVVNSPQAFGADTVNATILSPQGVVRRLRGVTKKHLAWLIIRLLQTDYKFRLLRRSAPRNDKTSEGHCEPKAKQSRKRKFLSCEHIRSHHSRVHSRHNRIFAYQQFRSPRHHQPVIRTH